MPAGVDESIWEKAKQAFKESYGRLPNTDKDYAIVMEIYKKIS
jgi:hypothetical protein